MVDDTRAAMSTLLSANPKRAALLCAAMTQTWIWSGRAIEALQWSERTLAANPVQSTERCWNLFMHARLLAVLGRGDESRAYLAEAEAEAVPEPLSVRAHFMLVRAVCHHALGDRKATTSGWQDAIEAFTQIGDEHNLARALNHRAMSMLWAGRVAEARQLAQRAIEIRRRVHPQRVGPATDTMAQAHAFLGELDQAKERWIEAFESELDLGWGRGVTIHDALFGLALVAGVRGKNQLALRLHYCAERTMSDVGGIYEEPISPKEGELIARLEAHAGPEAAAALRAEGESLIPEEALRLAKAEV
jgi:tetratricopeptide (TPR) repeat protein